MAKWNHLSGTTEFVPVGTSDSVPTPPFGASILFINKDDNYSLWMKRSDGTSVNTGSGYTLPVATALILGGVKQGANTTIAPDGTLSVAAPYVLPAATALTIGGVKPGTGLSVLPDGTLNATAGITDVTGNALFVDAVNGNDGTATTDSLVNKYQTINAAVAAAGSGDVIVVYPGTYNGTTNMYKDGVTFYFYPGANVVGAGVLFAPPAAAQTCKVYGSGNFTSTGTSVLGSNVQATFYMEAYDIVGERNTIEVRQGFIEVHGHNIISNTTGAINIQDSAVAGNRAIVTANDIQSFTGNAGNNPTINVVTGGPGYQGYFRIVANRILGTPNGTAEVISMDNYIVPGGATIEIIANTIEAVNTGGSSPVAAFFWHNNTKTIIKADIITVGSRPGIITYGNNTGSEIIVDGNITSVSGDCLNIDGTGTGDIVRHNGTLKSTGAAQVVTLGGSSTKLYLNGVCQNTFATGIGINKTVPSPTAELIVNDLTVITNAGASYNAPAPDTIIVRHSSASNVAATNITNAITGSAFFTDAAIQ